MDGEEKREILKQFRFEFQLLNDAKIHKDTMSTHALPYQSYKIDQFDFIDDEAFIHVDNSSHRFTINNIVPDITDLELPRENTEFVRAMRLDLMQIQSISDNIGDYQNLQYLSLDINNIDSLPSNIAELSKLRYLSIDHCQLEEYPVSMVHHPLLEHIYISHNKLSEVPVGIETLKNLKNLEVINNTIHEIPEEMGKLDQLSHLDFRYNYIKELPDSLYHLEPEYVGFRQQCPISIKIGILFSLIRKSILHLGEDWVFSQLKSKDNSKHRFKQIIEGHEREEEHFHELIMFEPMESIDLMDDEDIMEIINALT